MEKKFARNLALVGVGYWGKNLARNFFALGALHTICESNQLLWEHNLTSYPGVKLVKSLAEALSNPEIKAVAIAAPAFVHYELAKQALLAGKDVYVEKPLCLDSGQAEELVALAESKGLILMVGHLLQYHPCVRHLQELIGRGELGKLQYIVSNRLNLGSYRTEENALWNFAPHDVSVILSLCGHQLPHKVRCVGASYLSEGVADTSMTLLNFDGDVRAHIFVSWLNPFKEQKLSVVGSSGMAVFDDTKPWGEKLLIYRNHVTWTHGKIPVAPAKVTPEKADPAQQEPLKEECIHFLTCCEQRINPLTDGHEGLRVLKVLQAAQASLDLDGEALNPVEQHHMSLSKKSYHVHPTAIVDAGAEIGQNVQVWHYSHISGEVKIGANCKIGQNVYIAPKVVLGQNVKVQNNVSLYSGVVCEDDVFLGPSMVFTNILNPRSEIVRRNQYVPTYVRKGATVGANATIICGVELGAYCFIGAGAVVTKSVKPFALIVGNPGKQVGWMSRFGERLELPLSADSKELSAKCPSTGEIYILRGDTLSLMTPDQPFTTSKLARETSLASG